MQQLVYGNACSYRGGYAGGDTPDSVRACLGCLRAVALACPFLALLLAQLRLLPLCFSVSVAGGQ
eukprot:6191193-Pleurochrysis_carterae.AAC.3